MSRRDVGEGMKLDVGFRGKNPASSALALGCRGGNFS